MEQEKWDRRFGLEYKREETNIKRGFLGKTRGRNSVKKTVSINLMNKYFYVILFSKMHSSCSNFSMWIIVNP